MAEGRSRELWSHTSALLAHHANVVWRLKRPMSPERFNPYCQTVIRKVKRDLRDFFG